MERLEIFDMKNNGLPLYGAAVTLGASPPAFSYFVDIDILKEYER